MSFWANIAKGTTNPRVEFSIGKPPFEICYFYMVIANVQIALDSPPLSNGQPWKKCPKTSWPAFNPPPPYRQCPYGNNTFQKGAFLTKLTCLGHITSSNTNLDLSSSKSRPSIKISTKWVSQLVSDKGSRWLDSGPTKSGDMVGWYRSLTHNKIELLSLY